MPVLLVVLLAVLLSGAASAAAVFVVLRHTAPRDGAPPAAPDLAPVIDAVIALADDKLGERVSAERRAQEARDQAMDHNLDLRDKAVGRQVDEMRSKLDEVTTLVRDLGTDRQVQHGQLMVHLEAAAEGQNVLRATTEGLRAALAHPKARGSWGERTAEDLLRTAGLVEGVSFHRQRQLGNGTRPDVTFVLPRGRCLHMDVKFPADNYLRMLEADDEVAGERHRKAFLGDVRTMVRDVTRRGYLDDPDALDCLLLFVPNEAIYSFIHEQDPKLADEALRQRVLLCSPFTLMGLVTVIRETVEVVQLQRRSDEILRRLADFRNQWDRFSKTVDLVDKQLQTLAGTVSTLKGTRSSQLQRRIDAIAALGLPDEDLPQADDVAFTLVAVGGEGPRGADGSGTEELAAGS